MNPPMIVNGTETHKNNAKKVDTALVGKALVDPRSMAIVFTHINTQNTGNGNNAVVSNKHRVQSFPFICRYNRTEV